MGVTLRAAPATVTAMADSVPGAEGRSSGVAINGDAFVQTGPPPVRAAAGAGERR